MTAILLVDMVEIMDVEFVNALEHYGLVPPTPGVAMELFHAAMPAE